MTEQEILKQLETDLYPDRYKHTLGVAQTAVYLAKIYGIDEKKAYLAGVLHDCAKNYPKDKLYKLCEELEIKLDEVSNKEPRLLHAYIGAVLAKDKFGVDDEEIFDAIYYHTIAKENMPLLTKIIYISDVIEPNRKFNGELEAIRALAVADLNRALIMALDFSIKHVIRKGGLLHPNTLYARNYLVKEKSDGQQINSDI